MAATLQTCRRYAQHFSRQSGNLLLNGNPGLGKTFLSVCIAQAVAAKGYSVVYVPAGHMFAQMEQAKFSGSEEARQAAEKYTACDLLVVDDLGAEMVTPFVQSALYGVLNDRLLDGIPTVVSSNLQAVDFSGRYGPAIASRLLGSYRLVAFVGEDVRPTPPAGSIRLLNTQPGQNTPGNTGKGSCFPAYFMGKSEKVGQLAVIEKGFSVRQNCPEVRAGTSGQAGYSMQMRMCTSSSCFCSTTLGASIIRSWAFLSWGR